MNKAKAYVAGAIAFLTSLTAAWVVGSDFEYVYLLAAAVPGLTSFSAVYWVPNEEE